MVNWLLENITTCHILIWIDSLFKNVWITIPKHTSRVFEMLNAVIV